MYAQFYAAAKEARVGKFMRQFHRWVSAFFVLSVIATTIALARAEPIMWMSFVPLLPLALLALSGIYLFVQPYLSKRRTGA